MERLLQQIQFLVEIDKLKTVLRQTRLIDADRRENSAEHSWHLAVAAMVLAEHANDSIDLAKVLKMVLIHDLVEIDAGDTFCYDYAGYADKALREERAAERIFGLLPQEQGREFRALWQEFEERATPEARFAAALDRFMPVLHNLHTGGGTWTRHGITRAQVEERNSPMAEGSVTLWAYISRALDEAEAAGILENWRED
ncbi:MAG TPA: HD domain-containing protein [Bacillota bacterium]|nr:HD domain-containing protein [Bacillota bacterium]HPZ89993.1 HD domain-containing protein [Bacillota bacterium]HQE01400.1 HD domain-containing protein [Bacillota bacterium]